MKKKLSGIFLASLLLFSGCGSRDQIPEERQTIHYGISNAWDSLMPYNSVSGSNYARIVYDKLYDRLAYVHADGSLSPRAAKSWESADDGKAILFYLDENAKFHDGTPVTAEHWVQTFQLLTNPDCPTLGRSNFNLLSGTDSSGVAISGETLGAELLDQYIFKLTFQQTVDPSDFLNEKNREFYVLPTHLLGEVEPKELMNLPLWSAPIGSGPCRFVSELPGSRLVLEPNNAYQLGTPDFDELVMTVLDKSNLLTALLASDLDYYAFGGNISVEDAEVARKSGLTIQEGTVPNTFYELMLNGESISDVRIRQAMDYALDKQLLCEQSSRGLGVITGTSIVPKSPYEECSAPARQHDVVQAIALLSQSDYDGQSYTMACTSNRMGLAALMQQQFAAVGLMINIETVDSATMFAGMSDGTYDMAIASHTPAAVPLWFVESRFTQSSNMFHVPDLEMYSARMTAIRGESNPAQKKALVTELDAVFYEERPFLPLWFGRALHVQSPTIEGIDYASSSFSNENVWEWRKH